MSKMRENVQNMQKIREHRENIVLNYYTRLHEKKAVSQILKREAVEKMTMIKKNKNRQTTRKLKKAISSSSGGGDNDIETSEISGNISNNYMTQKNPDVVMRLFDEDDE
jgi:hypothetical protein